MENQTICYICQNYTNHMTVHCPYNVCKFCGELGHVNKHCPYLIRTKKPTLPANEIKKEDNENETIPLEIKSINNKENVELFNETSDLMKSLDEQLEKSPKMAEDVFLKPDLKTMMKYEETKQNLQKRRPRKKKPDNFIPLEDSHLDAKKGKFDWVEAVANFFNEQKKAKDYNLDKAEIVNDENDIVSESIANDLILDIINDVVSKDVDDDKNAEPKELVKNRSEAEKFLNSIPIPSRNSLSTLQIHTCENQPTSPCPSCFQFKFSGSEDYGPIYNQDHIYVNNFIMEISKEIYDYFKSNNVFLKLFSLDPKTSKFRLEKDYATVKHSTKNKVKITFYSKSKKLKSYSDYAKKIVAQVPRNVNDKLKDFLEDVINVTDYDLNDFATIYPGEVQKMKLRLCHNTRLYPGYNVVIKSNYPSLPILDELANLTYEPYSKSIVTYVRIQNSSREKSFDLTKGLRIGKIIEVIPK